MIRLACLVVASLSSATVPASAARAVGNDQFSSGKPNEVGATDGRHSLRSSRFAKRRRRAPTVRSASSVPLQRVAAATRAAVLEPASHLYVGAAQVYAWTEGALYRLYAAPQQISDIALQPGEKLVSVAAGDTARWVIGDTTSGSASSGRTHILVKPVASGLRTNIVIATDRRLYDVEAVSTARTAMASISWTYPADMIAPIGPAPPPSEAIVAPGVAVENLDFDYRITGDNVEWRPMRAFDDGHQVFIEFPTTLSETEAPPLFILGETGKTELVNYRQKGRYYVVDALFAVAELRLGGKRQRVVRIIRDGNFRRQGRSA